MPQQFEILLPNALDHGFDYAAPEGTPLAIGDMVRVPIGNRESLGVVWAEGTRQVAEGKLKTIITKLDFPPLSEAFRAFIRWSAWYNCAPLGTILKMVLAIDDAQKEGRKKIEAMIAGFDKNALSLPPLSDMQKNATRTLTQALHQGFSVTLLDGVTGSGKTEIYFDAIARKLTENNHNQILVLLPEIALSVQWLARFEARFGFAPAVWHSNITPAKRRATWQAIAKGQARVVIGARSSLYLPYHHLSFVVVDEEHDGSYKQEDGVIYHARDMAIARASHEKIPVVLVSATPSLESVHNVRMGRYGEITLPARHAEAAMPDIHMLDMRNEKLERGAFIAHPLRDAIADALKHGHQAMLFLNRRGYAPLVLCRKCGHRFQCPDCSAWLVMHERKTPYLSCHHCHYRIPLPKACPSCQTEDSLHACGPGVERIVEEISSYLPQAKVATLASDSTGNHKELSRLIQAMENKEIDILVGTQMIAKGHHFADLAVVGVVDADLGLAGGDLRAAEKTYQLLHQISGRAGREQVRGHVYLQSFTPEHPVMKALVAGQRDAFFTAELQSRENSHMPPFSRLAALIIEGKNEAQVHEACKALSSVIRHPSSVAVLGPAPAPLSLLRGKFRYRFLVKADRNINVPEFMRGWTAQVKIPHAVRLKIDIDPINFM